MFTLSRQTLVLGLIALIIMWGCAGIASADFYDGFDSPTDSNWTGIPTGSISGGILTLSPPDFSSPATSSEQRLTSVQNFQYGTFKMKFRTTINQGNYIYMGWFSRSPWANPAAYTRLDGGKMVLSVASGTPGQGDGNALLSQVIAPSIWHTVTIIRRPDAVILLVDDVLVGTYTNYTPTASIPLCIDAVRLLSTPMTYEVDYVSVTSGTDMPSDQLSFLDHFDISPDTGFAGWESIAGLPWASIADSTLIYNPPTGAATNVLTAANFQYGTYTCKFSTTRPSYAYLGYWLADPWAGQTAYARLDGGLNLSVGDGVSGNGNALASRTVSTDGSWHTLNIVRKPTSVDMYYDGETVGSYTAIVPTAPMRLAHSIYNPWPSMTFKSDYVSVSPRTDKPDFKDTFDDNPDNFWMGVPNWANYSNGVLTLEAPPDVSTLQSQTWYRMEYGTLTCKFKLSVADGNFALFGCQNRLTPWANPAAYVRFQFGKFYLVTGNGTTTDDSSVATPTVTPNVWHTIKIARRPTSVSLSYDGQWVGTSTKCVPAGGVAAVYRSGRSVCRRSDDCGRRVQRYQ